MKSESNPEPAHLKVDEGMTSTDLVMAVVADVGGFKVVRPKMPESTILGSALAAYAVGLFSWDTTRPETLVDVNTARSTVFVPHTMAEERRTLWRGW